MGKKCTTPPIRHDYLECGYAIKQIRLHHNWRQVDLAKRYDLAEGAVCYWEQGRTKPRPGYGWDLASLAPTPELCLAVMSAYGLNQQVLAKILKVLRGRG